MTSNLDSSKDYRAAWGLDDEPAPDSKNKIPPFFNIEDVDNAEKSEGDKKKWFETAIPILQDQSTDFTRKAVENAMFTKGVHLDPNRDYYNFDDANRFFRQSDVSFNIIYEFVELWVNRLGTYKADISCTPSTNDPKARDNAKAKELALKDFFHKNKINQLLNVFDRQTFTLGEGYIHCSWDPNRGALHPAFEEIERTYKNLERVSTSGSEVNINRLPRIGDVKVEIVPAIYVYFEDRPWDQLDYIILDIPQNIDKLRSQNPDLDLKGDGDVSCYWMYHLPTEFLPKGRFVKYACGEIIDDKEFPFSRFPVIRMTNIDVIGSSRGRSFIENVKSHQILINQTITEVWNNIRRGNKGKWVVPAKTVNPRHLHPQAPAIEYYGTTPPQFISYAQMPREAISFIELLREYAEKQARIQGIVQGAPPPNVRSGLQFAQLEEMEKKSVEITVGKKHAAIEELGEIIAMLMGKHYKKEDQRHITVFGKDKEYLTEAINLSAIKEDHSVRVKTDDLPTGKASQMSFYSELRGQFGPAVVPDEIIIDALDSGRFNQWTEFAGATVETTMSQIGEMIEGKRPEAPGEYEDLVLKWKIVVGTMRKRAYLTYSKEVKKLFEDTVYVIEDMLINKENKTQMLEQQLQELKSFPIYYKPEVVKFEEAPIPAPAGAPMEQGMVPPDGLEEMPPELAGGVPQI